MADGSEAPTGAVAASARATLAPKDALGWVDKRSYPRKLRGMLALDDFERVARRRLPRPIYGYVAGGVETDASLRGNRAVFDEIAFVPKMLVDTSARSLETTLFGHTYDAPFGLAPMGGSSLAACQGDIVLARAAARANIPMITSGASLTALERVREAGATTWFQAYLPGEAPVITELVERAARGGYDTLVVTLDVQVAANRENNIRSGYNSPLRPTARLAWDCCLRPRWLFGTFLRTLLVDGMPHFENMGPRTPLISSTAVRGYGRRDRLAWPHVELIRRLWKGRLVLKGILDPEDARIARESGVDGIIVSNHGGRQLDGAIAPLRALPAVAAQAGAMTVMMDSGIRRGTDVLKALALGAQFVFIGRPFLYAAVVAGEAGVRHAIHLLREEIDRDMALVGVTSAAEMTPRRLAPARGSAFLPSSGA
ncbi:MAG: alpha-hydroxy-acid oxidizing protein [Betaproteobacteria bacterium]|nr:MAG: alpha-hydroxy-acid oxidizing protein [Betaproteobacteria bacterium]